MASPEKDKNNLEVFAQPRDVLAELQDTEKVVRALLATKHYQKVTADGIYAIVLKAKSMNLNPMDALAGQMYYVQGKVEMSAQCMNMIIRRAGHSITKDAKSSGTICILHGKRADNGDTWTESFSYDDAKQAGITGNATWSKYTKDMLFARALSRLARQLFPDVIQGCYVQGEISETPDIMSNALDMSMIDDESLAKLNAAIMADERPNEVKEKILETIQCKELKDIPQLRYDNLMTWIKQRQEKQRTEKIAATMDGGDLPQEAQKGEVA